MAVIAFVIAFALIVGAGGMVARADWAFAPKGRGGHVERLWVILPALLLALLLALAGVEAFS